MSSSLRWRPLPAPDPGTLGDGIKHILRRHLGWADSEDPIGAWTPLDASSVPFLQGVIAAGLPDTAVDARTLVELIEKHGTIEIKEEW